MINILCQTHLVQKKCKLNHLGRIMKLSVFLFFCFAFSTIAENVSSQNARITLNKQNVAVSEVLNAIEEQTEYLFLYNKKNVNVNRTATIHANNESVSQVLAELFEGSSVSYTMEGKHIVLTHKESNNVPGAIQQDGRTITGVIKDVKGETVVGANVVVLGSTNGTITDFDGNFTLNNVPDKAVLQISFIGYLSKEVAVGKQSSLNILLTEDTQKLDEVVVVGYGTQRKRDVAGSIASISNKDLNIQSASNIQNLLQGRMSGVSVATSGVAGEAPSIRIRGIGTMSSNNPLYVIDGFPTKSELASQINPSSIESVQVLKDASSASIYGAQAANGVILITTKQGKTGKTTLDVKLNAGVQLPSNLPEMLNSQQYGEVLWNAMKNAGLTPSHSQYGNGSSPVIPDYILPSGAFEGQVDLSNYNKAENQYMRANKVGTNWADEVYRPAQTINLDVSAQGGGEDSKYFLSANYFTQDALVKWAGYDRVSLRGNSQFKVFKGTTLGANMSATYSKYKGAKSDENAVLSPSLLPVYDVMGNWAGTKANGLGDAPNPVAKLYNQKDNYANNLNLLANLFLEINFLESFQFKTTVGANIENGDSKSFSPVTYWDKGDNNTLVNSLRVGRGNRMELVWNNTLTYTKKFLTNHNINVLLGTEAISSTIGKLEASRSNFIVEDPDYRYLDAGELNKNNLENGNEYALFSLFTRVNYQYMDKYYLSGILRRDGSSRFGEDNRYGYFPGVSAAWRISEEAFMSNQPIFSDLKLRGSYGLTGNQDIGDYAFASTYGTNISTSSYPIAGDVNNVTQGIGKETIGNQGIKWETTTQTNIGVDAGFLNNKLNVVFDYYRKYTSDILQRVSYPSTGGVATSPYVNIGEMLNKGFEFNVNYANSTTKDFRYEVGVVLSSYKNRVEKLASDQFIANTYTRTEVGRPISSFYGYIIDGIFQTQEEVDDHAKQNDKAIGRWKYRDVNNDGTVDDKDRDYIGSPHPKFEYSLNGRFNYKNFDLAVYIQGTYGNDICFATKGDKKGTDFWGDYFNKSTRILDTWTVNNRDASLPEINILNPNNETNKVSTYLIEDGSYIRLKSLEFGYTIPTQVLSKISVKQCRVYVNAENLLTLTKYNNMDPEVKNGNNNGDDLSIGVDYIGNMPLARIFSVGFNVSF